jgi:LPS export ABC transporter protein LptC
MPLFGRNDHDPRPLMTDLALSTQNFRPSASTRAVVVGAATVFALSSCESDLDASQVALEEHVQRQSPAQIIEDGVFHYTERGALVNVLEATRIERWEPQDASTPEVWVVDNGFVLYIGGGKDDHQAALSATRGTYDDVHGHLEAWEHVELVNASGDRLHTEHLVWLHDSDIVRTTRPVEITTAKGVLRGRGLKADSRFERYEILAPTGSFDLGLEPATPDSL